MFRTVVEEPFPATLEPADAPAPLGPLRSRSECLEQILGAFTDIADFDDIHQAAQRLVLVQEWIRGETRRAAADPIFDD